MSVEERKEVLREHFDECLKHFGNWFSSVIPKHSHGRYEAMKPMIKFTGAHRQAVQRWLDVSFPLPVGEYRLKLMCYLDLHGYKVIEFEQMTSSSKVMRNFAELIGYGVLSFQKATELLSIKSPNHIYRILWCECALSGDKENQMMSIWKERRHELEEKKKEAWEKSRLQILFKPRQSPKPLLQLTSSFTGPNGIGYEQQVAILAILDGSLTLLDGGLFDGLPESELVKFAQPILQLSSRLSVLSSKVLVAKGD